MPETTKYRCRCGQSLLVEGQVIGTEHILMRPFSISPAMCIRLCEAMAAFWGDGVCDAAIHPGAYITEEDVPIRDLVRIAVGWRKP